MTTSETHDKAHGRLETRRCTAMRDLSQIVLPILWPGLTAIAQLERTRHHVRSGKKTSETAYIIASHPTMNAEDINAGIRRHWQIENNRTCAARTVVSFRFLVKA